MDIWDLLGLIRVAWHSPPKNVTTYGTGGNKLGGAKFRLEQMWGCPRWEWLTDGGRPGQPVVDTGMAVQRLSRRVWDGLAPGRHGDAWERTGRGQGETDKPLGQARTAVGMFKADRAAGGCLAQVTGTVRVPRPEAGSIWVTQGC